MKFTLLIAALNDAACAQLRKADSDDLNDHPLRTHTYAHTHSCSDCSIEKHGIRFTEDGCHMLQVYVEESLLKHSPRHMLPLTSWNEMAIH